MKKQLLPQNQKLTPITNDPAASGGTSGALEINLTPLLRNAVKWMFFLVFACLVMHPAQANIILVTSSTNWSALTGGSGTAGAPGTGDTVRVRNGATLTVDVNNAVSSLVSAGQGGSNNNTSTLAFANNGVLTITRLVLGGNLNRFGSVDMTAGGLLQIAGVVTINNLGTFTAGTGTIEYNATTNQTVNAGLLPAYNNLILTGGNRKTLNGNLTVNGTLTINNGRFNIGAFILTIGAGGTLDVPAPGNANMILASNGGEVRKIFAADGAFTYHVGDNTGTANNYAPIALTVSGSAYSNAYIAVSLTEAKHPDNASATHFIKRYWSVRQSGITGCSADVTARYVNADIAGAENAIISAQLSGAFSQLTNPWVKFSNVNVPNNLIICNGSPLTDGVTSVYSGITRANPTASITGGNVTVCPGAPVQLGTNVTGDPAFLYSWSPATGLNSTSIADPIATPATTTIYTVTVYDGNGITATANTTITTNAGTPPNQPGGISGALVVCAGQMGLAYSVQPVAGAVSYSWTVPAGATIVSGTGTNSIVVDMPNPFTSGSICVSSLNSCGTASTPRCTTLTNITNFTPNTIVGSASLCPNTTGNNYHVQAVSGATSYDWTVPAGVTIASGQGTSSINVDVGGTFTGGQICVTISNGCGTSLARCKTVTSTGASTPGGISGSATVCANTTGLVYSINAVSGATSYTWSVPSGFTIASGQGSTSITVDAGANPVGGDICVVANYACGSSQPRCLTIAISGTALGTITGPASVCIGTAGINYMVAPIAGAISYNWTLPTGMTQTGGGTTNSITVSIGAGFVASDICVTVTTICGTGLPKCRTIQVTSPNTPGPITGPQVICAGSSNIQYSIASVTGATSYNWTGTAGMTITAGNTRFPNVSFSAGFVSGTLCVNTISACGTSSPQVCIDIYDVSAYTPPAITGSGFVCINSTNWIYSIPALAGVSSYNWVLPAGMSFSPGTNPDSNSVSIDVDGTFVTSDLCVTITATCGGTSLSRCLNIVEFSGPPNTPGGISGDKVVCPPLNNVVYSINPVFGASSYTWTVPAGMTIVSGANSLAVTVNIDPGYTSGDICVTATSPCGLISTARCLTVTLNTISTPPNINGATVLCLNATNQVFRISAVSGAASYNWLLPNGVTFSAGAVPDSNVVLLDIGPTFTSGDVCVATSGTCGLSNYRCKAVIEITRSIPGGISGPEIVCANTTGVTYSVQPVLGASSYEWFVPPGVTITSVPTDRIITVDFGSGFTTGDIGVRAVAPCGDKSQIRWNNTTTSVNPAQTGFISVSGDVCPGSTVIFSVNPVTDADSYEWILPNGMTFTGGNPTNTNSVSVDIGAGFILGDVCVKAVSACGITGYMRCATYNIHPLQPSTISGPIGVCPGATGVAYSVNAVANASSYEWTLPAGWNITAGTGTNAITVDVAAGFFQGQISVNAVSPCGNKSPKRYLNISTNPATPGTISGASAPCPGTVVVYSISTVNGASGYSWTLPTGMTVTSGTPNDANSISLDVDGSYTGGDLCVAALTSCGGTSANSCITLGTTPPAPVAIIGDPTVCAGTNGIGYSVAPVAGAISYTWTAPTGMTIQSGQGFDAIVVDLDPGFTGGSLCVTANTVCNASASTCLNIGLLPGTPTDIIQGPNFCPGTAQTLSVERIPGATNYNWTVPAGITVLYGDGTPNLTVFVDPSYTPGQVCVEAETPCGASGGQYCETIDSNAPAAPASITASSVVCPGNSIIFSATSVVDAGTFDWTVPAGMTITGGQGTASIAVDVDPAFTSGQVCVSAVSACGAASANTCATYSITPATPGAITAPPVICTNSTGNILSVTQQAGISSYDWVVPAGLTITAGQGSNTIEVSASGAFSGGQVSVTAVSFCGNASAPRTATINNLLPNPSTVTFSAPTCNNTTGIVCSVTLQTGATSYIWSVPPDITITSGQGTNVITIDIGSTFQSGQICVQGVSVCGDPGTPRCPIVRSVPNQPGNISGTFSNVCGQTLSYSCPNTSGATSYFWTPPNNAVITNGQGTQTVEVTFSGSFTSGQLEVVAVNSCGNSAPRLSQNITCGPVQQGPRLADTPQQSMQLHAYPVPASASLTVDFESGVETTYVVELTDLQGRIVLTQPVASVVGLNRITLDVSELPSGLYLLRAHSAEGASGIQRILVE